MCGIVGYIGKNAQKTLFEMLKKLEYRGYDSAGIATISDGAFEVIKTEGAVENLKPRLNDISGEIGIGHTRWATHGKPNLINAHPHLSPNKEWAIVHNGIIENYAQLKQDLIKEGMRFNSQTDTEVIAALFEKFNHLSQNEQIQKVVSMLEGSFAFAAISKNYPESIILAKKKSPLYLAFINGCPLASSDPIAFESAKQYYIFNDNEYCVASTNTAEFFSFSGKKLSKKTIALEEIKSSKAKNFPHHMLEEINQSSTALKNLSMAFNSDKYQSKIKKIRSFDFNKIFIVGCGTAYHSGLVGAKYLEKALKIPVSVYVASEFKYNPPLVDKNSLCIFVSQSGETADTIASLILAKRMHAKTVSIVNSNHSTLSRLSNISLPIHAGIEIAVASTKAYTNQCATFFLLAKALRAKDIESTLNKQTKKIVRLAKTMYKMLHSPLINQIEALSQQIKDRKKVFFIGKNFDYITALEASLKLKEISYISCFALPAGELKHGSIALVESGVEVIAISTQKRLAPKVQNATSETQSRGASTLVLTPQPHVFFNSFTVCIPKTQIELAPIISIIPLWLLSYFVSIKRGINPDKPRNLAKSVTVE